MPSAQKTWFPHSECSHDCQKFSLFMSSWEFDISTNWSDFSSILGSCHAVYHFPNSTSNDSRFVHYDLHHVTSFFLDLCQPSEALQPTLMAMEGPHYLDMTNENDYIYLSVLDSHHDPISQMRNPYSQISQIFQNNHHKFYDPIGKWMEQYYLASCVAGN